MESGELGTKLQAALNQLPEKQRLAIVMFTIEQMPQKDVAEALKCSVEAVKTRLVRARRALADHLGDGDPARPAPARPEREARHA